MGRNLYRIHGPLSYRQHYLEKGYEYLAEPGIHGLQREIPSFHGCLYFYQRKLNQPAYHKNVRKRPLGVRFNVSGTCITSPCRGLKSTGLLPLRAVRFVPLGLQDNSRLLTHNTNGPLLRTVIEAARPHSVSSVPHKLLPCGRTFACAGKVTTRGFLLGTWLVKYTMTSCGSEKHTGFPPSLFISHSAQCKTLLSLLNTQSLPSL